MKPQLKHTVLGLALCAAFPLQAQQAKEGPFLVRVRALYMSVDNGNNPDIDLKADSKWFPEIDISYFFTPHIAAELVLTYPQRHDLTLGGADIGSVKHLPPTLMLQYHFAPEATFRPYVGIGLNYTHFWDNDIDVPGVTIDSSSVGLAFQVGADYKLGNGWFLNADIKYVDIDADVKAGGTKLTTLEVDPWLYSVGIGYRF